MATRSQVILINDREPVGVFYHHWDGYIDGGVGEELAKAFNEGGFLGVCDFIGNDSGYEDETPDDVCTDNIPLHQDIEFLYYVDEEGVKVLELDWADKDEEVWDYNSAYVKKNIKKIVIDDSGLSVV